MMSGRSEQNVPVVTGVMDGVHSTVLLLLMYVISLLLLMLPVVRLQSCWQRKLMQRVKRLSSVLELSVDCTGMSTEKMAKTVRQAAKHFLSSIHGRERNQMRRGTAKLRKVGAAVMVAIEAQM
jgi:hypothetical protein